MKKGFTLAEIMIVLAIIGVLTAILLPTARNSMPNEDIMKFKKAHKTFVGTIRELVTSDEYYKDGDLGIRANGALIDGTYTGDTTYLCETMAEIITTKSKNCSSSGSNGSYGGLDLRNGHNGYGKSYEDGGLHADTVCSKTASSIGAEIVLQDNTVFYQSTPSFTLGKIYSANSKRYFGSDNTAAHRDAYNIGAMYKIFCIDIDGIGKGEAPFGYGIRADGRIFNGARAQEWLKKSIQEND